MPNIQRIIEKHLKKKSIISYSLLPLSLLYSLLLYFRRKYYKLFFNRANFNVKIISIGNIVSGGTGKTPFVIYLAKYLSDRSYNVAVSHRGYKGDYEKKVTLISDFDGVYKKAEKAGDESLLIAKSLKGIPVVCGKNRKLSIKILMKKFPNLDYVILDDSFQHLKVHHDLDFVLFNEKFPLGNGFVIPAGILREPLNALYQADIFVWNGTGKPIKELKKFSKPIVQFHYEIDKIYDEKNNIVKINELQNKRVILISGIGNPSSFEELLKSQIKNLNIIKHFAFVDHFKYDKKSIELLKKFINRNKITYAITTEKDVDKIRGNNLNLTIVKIRLSISNQKILDELL